MRIGMVESSSPINGGLVVEDRETLNPAKVEQPNPQRPRRLAPEGHGHEVAEIVRFSDYSDREIVGLVDRNDVLGTPTVVVLQTGWGETKEALLPLARTIVDTFSAAAKPIVVLRIDGINQRGESYKDPDCRIPGREYNRFVFSQPISDLEAAVDFAGSRFSPEKTILVSQSISALAGRKAVARDGGRRIDGWICLVGAPDLQSASRSISGGIDFAVGRESGVRFGYQELLGVMIHADRMMEDAVETGLLHLADARNDFSTIDIPIVWYHGKNDAWIDGDRVEDIMSFGNTGKRKLIHIPIAHRLGWSSAALETYGLVAVDAFSIAHSRSVAPTFPERVDLARRRTFERERRPRGETDLRSFWKDYLIGRDESVGFELLTASEPYADLMTTQLEHLDLRVGDRLLDLGCGTGGLTDALSALERSYVDLRVVGLDLVPSALKRARLHLDRTFATGGFSAAWVASDLDVVEGALSIPVQDSSFDVVLASLFLSYVERPDIFLSEVHRVLKRGGRVVISSMLRDADLSRLYQESLAELSHTNAEARIPEMRGKQLSATARTFLNDASRILELEAEGAFQFWEPTELAELVASAGFEQISTETSFGFPPQAVVVSGLARR